MVQKDESLRIVTEAKQMLTSDPRLNDVANQQINYVLNLQAKNADSFKRLKENFSLSMNLRKLFRSQTYNFIWVINFTIGPFTFFDQVNKFHTFNYFPKGCVLSI